MKIVEEEKKNHYKVLRSFQYEGKFLNPGDEIVIGDEALGYELTMIGKVDPLDVPEIANYKAMYGFDFILNEKRIQVKRREIVSLRRSDAIQLMKKRRVIPIKKNMWCPFKEQRRKEMYFQELFPGHPAKGIMKEVPTEASKKKPFITSWKDKNE